MAKPDETTKEMLIGVGQHCAVCNTLDFLPYRCEGCGLNLCAAHRAFKDHACTHPPRNDRVLPTCPLCSQAVLVPPGVDCDAAVSDHIDKGCPQQQKSRRHPCSARGCKQGELVPVKCPSCCQNFCFKLRIFF